MTWTDERVEELKALAAKHLAASAIAAELGDGISRCAVLGKLNRLGIATGNGKGDRPLKRDPLGNPKSRAERIVAKKARLDARKEAAEAVDLPPDQSLHAMSFFESKPDDERCRYPLGDPANLEAFRYCGAPQEKGCPYCARHFRITHTKASALTDAEIERRRKWGEHLGRKYGTHAAA